MAADFRGLENQYSVLPSATMLPCVLESVVAIELQDITCFTLHLLH